MQITPSLTRTALGAGRVLVGAAFVAAPEKAGAAWFGDAASQPGTKIASRAFGARDVALGVATLATAKDSGPNRLLIALGIGCDVVDAASTLQYPAAKPPVRAASAATALGAAAAGLYILFGRE